MLFHVDHLINHCGISIFPGYRIMDTDVHLSSVATPSRYILYIGLLKALDFHSLTILISVTWPGQNSASYINSTVISWNCKVTSIIILFRLRSWWMKKWKKILSFSFHYTLHKMNLEGAIDKPSFFSYSWYSIIASFHQQQKSHRCWEEWSLHIGLTGMITTLLLKNMSINNVFYCATYEIKWIFSMICFWKIPSQGYISKLQTLPSCKIHISYKTDLSSDQKRYCFFFSVFCCFYSSTCFYIPCFAFVFVFKIWTTCSYYYLKSTNLS